MTVSSSLYSKKWLEGRHCFPSLLRGFLLSLTFIFCVGLYSGAARANNQAEIRYAELVPVDDFYVINADIMLELNSHLEEVLEHGIPLHFVAECIITRGRWYWWDEKIVERRLAFRLSYQPLTRTYRLAVGSFGQNFDQLADAFGAMKRLRNWSIIERSRLNAGESYNVALRFRLDTNQLPRPFQVTAIGSRDWDLATPWSSWTFLAAR
jgi:hypothetical protein